MFQIFQQTYKHPSKRANKNVLRSKKHKFMFISLVRAAYGDYDLDIYKNILDQLLKFVGTFQPLPPFIFPEQTLKG